MQLGILFNQGQVCCAGSRVFVQSGIYDQFVEALKEKFEQVNVGFRGKKMLKWALRSMSINWKKF